MLLRMRNMKIAKVATLRCESKRIADNNLGQSQESVASEGSVSVVVVASNSA